MNPEKLSFDNILIEITFKTKTRKTTIFKAVQNDGFLEKFMRGNR
ncbi:MAG: hypothetical protein ABH986_04955 [archaeon]